MKSLILKKVSEKLMRVQNYMPVSKRLFATQNMAIVAVLEAHAEFQMLNRQDIMGLATTIAKMQNPKVEQKETKPKKKDMMYG